MASEKIRHIFSVLILSFSLLVSLSACERQKITYPVKKENDVHLITATDLHYLSPSLFDDGEMFHKLLETNDGKLIENGEEILNVFVSRVKEEKPDALLLTGDLTFNGEKQSLKEVKEKLEDVQKAGIPVLVLPGNHDIAYPYAESYHGNTAVYVENVSQNDWKNMMQEFGYQQAIMKDKDSFSYLYALSEDLYVLALDANTQDNPGTLSSETEKWMKKALNRADQDGAHVICMSHQNVLKQSEFMYKGFVMDDHETVAKELEDHHVYLNLSGHSHLQHEVSEKGLHDICTESLSLYPLSYAEVTIPTGRKNYTYQKKSIGVLQDESKKRFNETVDRQIDAEMKDSHIPADDLKAMTVFAENVNRSYFTGEKVDKNQFLTDPAWKLWKKYGSDSFWYVYMNRYLKEK